MPISILCFNILYYNYIKCNHGGKLDEGHMKHFHTNFATFCISIVYKNKDCIKLVI